MKNNNFIKYTIIFCLCIIISSFLAITLVQLPAKDFYNFHFYNGWAFLNNRLDIDIMPALFRTYFNPLLDGLLYILINKFNYTPDLYFIIDNIWYGAYIFISYLIFDFTFKNKGFEKYSIIVLCLLLTIFSPMNLWVAKFINGIATNTMILLAFYLFISNIFKQESNSKNLKLVLSAIIAGAATGIKYTCASYCIGLLACLVLNKKFIKNFAQVFILTIIFMFCGFCVTGGWWMYMVYARTNNPIYPYFNNIFNPHDGDTSSIFAQDFMPIRPKNLLDFIFYPLKNSNFMPNAGFEGKYFDIKIPLTFLFSIVWIVIDKIKSTKNVIEEFINPNVFYTSLIFITVSFYINVLIFGQIRYMLALFPIMAMVLAVFCYIFSKVTNTSENSNIFTLITIIACGYYVNSFFYYGESSDILILLYFIISILLITINTKYITFIKQKGFITSIGILVLIFLSTNNAPFRFISSYKTNSNIVYVEKMDIKSNSAVLLTPCTSFIVPFQNKNAKYIGISVPKVFSSEKDNKTKHPDYYFQNKKLEKEISKALKNSKDAYLIYNTAQFDLKYYNMFLKYYSNNTTKDFSLNTCKEIHTKIIGEMNNFGQFYLCKIK